MARIRSVKPELRTDLTVSEWPREVRYAWVLLLGYLDDYGRGRDDSRLVVADLFPLDRDVTERKINLWLDRMAKSGPLCRYNVDGQGYMHAVKWSNHQRISHPTDSRIPPCPIHDLHEPIPSNTGSTPETRRKNSGADPEPLRPSRAPAEQGAGSREQGTGRQGAGIARATPPPDDGTEPTDTERLVAEWVALCRKPPPQDVRAAVAESLHTLLAEGQDLADVRNGLLAWFTKGLHPKTLPSVVNEVMNRQTASRATTKAAGWLALGNDGPLTIEGRTA
jgi:hypothetical protein